MEVQEIEKRLGPWPWLLFKLRDDSRIMSVFSKSNENEPRVTSIPEFENKLVYNCSHGWLILSFCGDSYTEFSLWNPVSFESIILPRLESSVNINACILSSDPCSLGSMVFLFNHDSKIIFFCRVHGDDKLWINRCYEKELTDMDTGKYNDYLRTPIICEGKLYCLTYLKMMLVQIEVLEKDDEIVLVIQPLLPCPLDKSVSSLINRQLIESCGEIFLICIIFENRESIGVFGNEILGVEVHKLNFVAKAWERRESVGDRAFFSSNGGIGFSCVANINGIKGNHIYFTRLQDLHLYSYDMEKGLLSIRVLFAKSQNPRESSTWIMPHIRSENSFGQVLGIIEKEKQIRDGEMIEAIENEENALNPRNCRELPLEIMKYLSYKLNFFSYKNFGAVSSNWREAAPPSEVNFDSPWLLFFQKSKGVFNIVGPELSDRYTTQGPESLRDSTICSCKDGWLLMCKYTQAQDHQLSVKFVNPFTKNIIQYPDLYLQLFRSSRFSFSCSPTSLSCVVIVLTFPGNCCLNVCCSREAGWKSFQLGYLRSKPYSFCNNNQIFVNRDFYFMNHYRDLEGLRLEGDIWGCESVATGRKYLSHYQGFLAECNGEIISVFINDMGEWKGFKLNHSTSLWEMLTTLGKYTMYASRMSSFIIKAETPEMEDKIYLPKFHEDGKMVKLCLRTGKYCSPSGDGSSKDWYGTREQLGACWIRPI